MDRVSPVEPFAPLIGRIPVLDLTPRTPDPRWNPKAYSGEVVPFGATVFREGHDAVGALLRLTAPNGITTEHRMRLASAGNDRWLSEQLLTETGRYRWSVLGFGDEWATWLHVAEVKLPIALDASNTRELGAQLCDRAAAQDRPAAVGTELRALAKLLRAPRTTHAKLLRAAHSASLAEEFAARPLYTLATESAEHTLLVERARAGSGAWYEMFPRSEGAKRSANGVWSSGTFGTAQKRLAEIAGMGFDVVYLPPIHPIGLSYRKGPNNTLSAGANDPGSPWAVGGAAGGHDSIHPDLGTLTAFKRFVTAAKKLGLEVALDLALQASPDHPWVSEHPEWFTTLPDGTIAYAENPPKKYQDIYPINFDLDPAGIYAEVLRVVEFWIANGIRIFRVDNPHTKPLEFWEWLIATVNATHPEVVFLAEAFTRPAMMLSLAMVGFQQSYSYFTWRNTKAELEEFLQQISHDTADFYRPNLWVNTPDILTEYLQFGGRAAFTIRATIAATAAPLWGMYAGFELFESVARPGAEESIDNEKYEYRPRDFAREAKKGNSLALYIGMLNQARREHPALGQLRNLFLQVTEDDAVLAYAKHLDGAFTPNGIADTVIVVANTDPHSVRETKIHLDLDQLGVTSKTFWVRDLITGDRWQWGAENYVRLDAFERPAHVLVIEREQGSDDWQRVAEGAHHNPHGVLGWHPSGKEVVIRALRPLADSVTAEWPDGRTLALSHQQNGIWAGTGKGLERDYVIRASYGDAPDWVGADPYRFGPTLGELDLHLIQEGRHEELWRVLGAHLREHEGVAGAAFAVWAPHATAVRVAGDFNNWDGTRTAMRSLGSSGIWELFIPGLEAGASYKYEIRSASGRWQFKADPMAQHSECPPATASRLGRSEHQWADGAWMSDRASHSVHDRAMSVYEMHLGSWRPGLSYRAAADELIPYLQQLHYTHVEFMPLAEHPFGGSWGYQVSGYYAPTARFGTADDLKYLIDRLHQAGLGVILDWVPGHFPKDEFALGRFDGEALYEHPDPRRGEQSDWGTYVFDFGNPRVRNFLVANALYWFEEFHIDGLRVDAVASMLYLDYSRKDGEWLPNIYGGRENLEAISFLQEVNATAYKRSAGIVMIAEESTSWPGVTRPTSEGGLGFGLKWNMGWMHDTLQYIERDPMYRSYHHGEITFSFMYAWSENFILPISHDEVVHGKGALLAKMPGDHWQKLANLRAYLAFMWAHPGKKLLFMGQEFGQLSEWSESRSLDWWMLDQPAHQQLQSFVGRLNQLYTEHPSLWQLDDSPTGFEWIEGGAAEDNVLAFVRYDRDRTPLVCLVNFAGHPYDHYRVGLPAAGKWNELLNSDALEYGGSGVGNLGTVSATANPWNGKPASAEITLPPLAVVWLKPAN